VVVNRYFSVAPADDALFANAAQAMAMDAQGANAALLAHAGGTPSGPCAPVSGSGPQAAMEASLAAEFCRAGGWVEATGSRMVVQGGYHDDAAGFLAGIDHAVGGARLGLAVGEGASALNDASGGKANDDTQRVGFYGAQALGSFTLSADVTDGFATCTTIRETGADVARGRDHGNVLADAVQLARPLSLGRMQLLPAAGVQAAQVRMGRMDEASREQAFALQTAASGATSLRPYLSLGLSEMLVTESQLVVSPQATLGVTYEAGDPGHAVRLTADDGTLFSAGARGMQGAGGQAMAGVSAGQTNWSLNARYTAEVSGGWSDQSLEAGLQIRW
jgi:outer membrane autotransporter protein